MLYQFQWLLHSLCYPPRGQIEVLLHVADRSKTWAPYNWHYLVIPTFSPAIQSFYPSSHGTATYSSFSSWKTFSSPSACGIPYLSFQCPIIYEPYPDFPRKSYSAPSTTTILGIFVVCNKGIVLILFLLTQWQALDWCLLNWTLKRISGFLVQWTKDVSGLMCLIQGPHFTT